MRHHHFLNKLHRWLTLGFFLIVVSIGLMTYQDYGVSWDEPQSRLNGIMSANYILAGDTALFGYTDRDYGVGFEVPLIAIERVFKVADEPVKLYPIRHLTTFLFFVTGLVGLYLITKVVTQSSLWSLVAVSFLSLSPRIWAHSFFNSKDIPFMVVYIWCLYWLLIFLQKRKMVHLMALAVFSGWLTAIRVLGLVTVPMVIAILSASVLIKDTKIKMGAKQMTVFASLTLLFTYTFWPYLWPDPVANLGSAFSRMSQFPWPGTVLYLGSDLTLDQIPWHYLPLWIGITTPITYLVGFVLYHLLVGRHFRRQISSTSRLNQLALLLWFWVPILSVYLFNSPIYDEYRQLFFIYPPLIVMSVLGFRIFLGLIQDRLACFPNLSPKYHSFIPKLLLIALISWNHVGVVTFMIKVHPFEHLYFNRLAGPNLTYVLTQFDGDYWGLTYKKIYDELLKYDTSPSINVVVANKAGQVNLDALDHTKRRRINLVELDHPDKTYYLTNYRWDQIDLHTLTPIRSVQILNAVVGGIYRF